MAKATAACLLTDLHNQECVPPQCVSLDRLSSRRVPNIFLAPRKSGALKVVSLESGLRENKGSGADENGVQNLALPPTAVWDWAIQLS